MSGTSANMMGIAVAQGKQEMVSGWATAAAIFKEMSGYLYAVLQALVLAMGPLVIIAMFIPGTGLKLVGSYMQVAVWLALWQPLLSIVNYIVLLYSQAQSTAVMGGSTGFTMQNIPVVSEFTSRMMLAGSFMATLVPLFAWGMVKGGMAVTDLITRGLSNQIMSQAGNVAATGNVTLGNESMNDNTIDQNMLMPKYSVGYGMVNANTTGNGFNDTATFGALNMTHGNSAISVSQTITKAQQVAYDAKSSDAFSEAGQVQLQKAILAGAEIVSQSGVGTGHLFNVGTSTNSGPTSELSHKGGRQQTAESNTGHKNSTSNANASTTGTSVGMGLGDAAAGVGLVALALAQGGAAPASDVLAAAPAATAARGVVSGGVSILASLSKFVKNPRLLEGLAGAGMLANAVHPKISNESRNTKNNEAVSGTGISTKTSSGPSGSYGNRAQVINQAMNIVTGLINGGTITSSKEMASLQKMYSHLDAAKKDFATSEAYKASESTAETVTIARGTPWGQGLAKASAGTPDIVKMMDTAHHMPKSPVSMAHIESTLLPKVTQELGKGRVVYKKSGSETAPVNAAVKPVNVNVTPIIGKTLGGPLPISKVENKELTQQTANEYLNMNQAAKVMELETPPPVSVKPFTFTPKANPGESPASMRKATVLQRYFTPQVNVGNFDGGNYN